MRTLTTWRVVAAVAAVLLALLALTVIASVLGMNLAAPG